MRHYHSIPRYDKAPHIPFPAYTYCKYDGTNIRAEFDSKRGWYKFGTRHRIIEKNDGAFGSVIPLFKKGIADDIINTIEGKPRNVLVFFEYLGDNSFAGKHVASDVKYLKLFDININQRGMLSPKDFCEIFEEKPYAAKFLGIKQLTPEYIKEIREANFIDEPHYEGVICKWGEGHNIDMCKIKTIRYLADLKSRFGDDWSKYE